MLFVVTDSKFFFVKFKTKKERISSAIGLVISAIVPNK